MGAGGTAAVGPGAAAVGPGAGAAGRSGALGGVISCLTCPVCDAPLELTGRSVRCDAGHSYDVARQGYVNLRVGHSEAGTADTAGMVAARERLFAGGHYRPVAATLAAAAAAILGVEAGTARAAAPHGPVGDSRVVIADLAAGTGYYLAAVLDAVPAGAGIATDLSTPALRRSARAHARAAAVGIDVWGHLPIATGSVALVLSVFGPRHPDEMARILRPGGSMLVVTPQPEHLHEVAGPLGLIGMEPAKTERLDRSMDGVARLVSEQRLVHTATIRRADAVDVAAMGPTARHVTPAELARRAAGLPDELDLTVAVRLARYRT